MNRKTRTVFMYLVILVVLYVISKLTNIVKNQPSSDKNYRSDFLFNFGRTNVDRKISGENELNRKINGETELNRKISGETGLNRKISGETGLNRKISGETERVRKISDGIDSNRNLSAGVELNPKISGGIRMESKISGQSQVKPKISGNPEVPEINSPVKLNLDAKNPKINLISLEGNANRRKQDKQLESDRQIQKHDTRPIPKIIHQIWNDEIIPTEMVKNVQGLVRDNPAPEWKYYFWTKDSGLKFIKKYFPLLFEKANTSSSLMRADILRYLVIYKYGGVYFDLDTVSVKPLKNFVETHTCSFASEPAEHYLFYSKTMDFLLNNGALLCVPRHPFYHHITQYLFHLRKECTGALSCTGPPVLSRMYQHLNKTINKNWLPDVQPSEVFQDVYDDKINRRRLEELCYNSTEELLPHHVKLCENWISRGKEKRTLSERAITYHTWYHTQSHKNHFSVMNRIQRVVPHAMLYGKDFT